VSPSEPGRGRAVGPAEAGLDDAGLAGTGVPGNGLPGNGLPATGLDDAGLSDAGVVGGAAPAQRDREEQRRYLRLVQNQARRRAGRRRLLVVLGIASVAAVGLALVALHVLIAENQFKLDRLQQRAATEQASYEKLRLQVAQLEAPARIVSEAEGQLGMVQPASVTYLPATTSGSPPTKAGGLPRTTSPGASPSRTSDGKAGGPPAADPPTTGTVTAPQGDSDWPSVKPYLSGSP
jgi:cell division protein FtsL